MGLHPDVKTFLRSRFPSSVGDAIPREPCEVLVCDHMWILFRFSPDGESTGEDLVDFVWGPILKFFRGGGSSYVCVFDVPERVPIAKAEEHKKRYAAKSHEKPSGACSRSSLPSPWHAALADRETRAELCAYVSTGLAERFRGLGDEMRDKELLVSGVRNEVVRARAGGVETCPEHAAVAAVGEGDLAVAYWAQHYSTRTVVARVLDSDQIPILMLRANLSERRSPLYVWLVSPKRPGEGEGQHGYRGFPPERHTLVDVLGLNAEIRKTNAPVEEWVYWIIAQKTDFTNKIVQNLGVTPTLAALEEGVGARRHPIITVNGSRATCDAEEIRRSFRDAAGNSKRKRAAIAKDADVEFRRAWWTLLYWSYGWEGPLNEKLRPAPEFGFDSKGMRTDCEPERAFPTFVA